MTLFYMAENPEPEACLSNMAGLVILSEFDNLIGYIFDLAVKRRFPKLEMIDDLLKDHFQHKNQKIAINFSLTYFFFIIFNTLVMYLNYQDNCLHFDQYFEGLGNDGNSFAWAYSKKGKIYATILLVNAFIGQIFFVLFPYLTVAILKLVYKTKDPES